MVPRPDRGDAVPAVGGVCVARGENQKAQSIRIGSSPSDSLWSTAIPRRLAQGSFVPPSQEQSHEDQDEGSRRSARARIRRRRQRAGRHSGRRAGPRRTQLRRQHRHRRLRLPGRRGRVARLRHRLLPRHRGRRARRPGRDQGRHLHRQDPLHQAQRRRGRRAVARHHHHLLARCRREAPLPRRQLLRRSGLHGPQGPRGRQRDRARRRLGVHPDRHHHRAQPRRLLPRQRHEVRGDDHRDQRRGTPELHGRTVRRVHHRRLRPRRHPLHLHRSRESHDSAGDHLQGAARPSHPPRRRPVVGHRDLGAERHRHRRGEEA